MRGQGLIFDNPIVTVYSYNMNQREKLLSKARRNPEGLSFSEFQTLMSKEGWVKDHQKGSLWYSLEGVRLSIQNRNGMAKGYQVRQFLTCLEKEKK